MFGISLLGAARSYRAAVVAASLITATMPAAVASATPGYGLDPGSPSIALPGEFPHGVAIDQASQTIYVTELTTDLQTSGHGQVTQLGASGVPTANSPFVTGSKDFFTGVAVNQATHSIYAYQTQIESLAGLIGTSKMSTFSSSGTLGASFVPPMSTPAGPQLAVDAAGRVYFPSNGANTVQVFDSSGALKESIGCSGCPGGPFSEPASVALDSAANLYVVDMGNGGRVIKFTLSGGAYSYDSVLEAGAGANAVAVDTSSDDVLVGDLDESKNNYHIVAYTSSGVQFDDFGGELITPTFFGRNLTAQIAANATTHKLFVSDTGGNKLWVFDRIASIPSPSITTDTADSVSQQDATLQGKANPKGHTLADCHFEYTDHTDFQANGYANATSVPCLSNPGGSETVTVVAGVGGLTPGTTYDYRLVGTSSGGSAEGTDQMFTTLPPLAPSVTTGSASAITQSKATLSGSVNPHGGAISDCHFEYVDEAGFKSSGFLSALSKECVSGPSGTVDEPVSAKISGLAADRSYRFKVVATNNSGTTEATDQVFKTLAETCATNPALCPPPEEKPQVPPPAAGGQLPAPVPPIVPAKKPLKCRKGFKKKVVRGKPKCVKVKKHRKRN